MLEGRAARTVGPRSFNVAEHHRCALFRRKESASCRTVNAKDKATKPLPPIPLVTTGSSAPVAASLLQARMNPLHRRI